MTYETWLQAQFEGDDLSDPQRTNPMADPGGFRVSNLLRYAFGLDPRQPDLTGLPSVRIDIPEGYDEEYLLLTFRHRLDSIDLGGAIEASGDLVDWDPIDGEDGLIVEVSLDSDGIARITVRDQVPVEESDRRFMRIVVKAGEPGMIDHLVVAQQAMALLDLPDSTPGELRIEASLANDTGINPTDDISFDPAIEGILHNAPASAVEAESKGKMEYTLSVAYHPRTDRSAQLPIRVYDGHLRGRALREAEPKILEDWDAFLDYLDDIPEEATIYWDTGCIFVTKIFVAGKVVSKAELARELKDRGIRLHHRFGF